MTSTENELSAEETTIYTELWERAEKGPRTADAIGEALWRIQNQHLYRDTVRSMNTFFSSCVHMTTEEGSKIIEDWKQTPRGRAVIAEYQEGREDDAVPSTVTDPPRTAKRIANLPPASGAKKSVAENPPANRPPRKPNRPDGKPVEKAAASRALAEGGQDNQNGKDGVPPESQTKLSRKNSAASSPKPPKAPHEGAGPLPVPTTSNSQHAVTLPPPSFRKADAVVSEVQTGPTNRKPAEERSEQPVKPKASKAPVKPKNAPATPVTVTPQPPARAVDQAASLDEWAARISEQVGKSARSLVELGQLFRDAKAALQHGLWEELFNSGKLRFSIRTAQKLMLVAKNQALSKTKNSSFLPPSLDTLATLARLDADVVQAGIDEGHIGSGTTIEAAQRFVLDQPESRPVKTERPFAFDSALKSLVKKVNQALDKVPAEARRKFAEDLLKEIKGATSAG